MQRPDILMPAPLRAIVPEGLEKISTLHKTFEAADPEAAIDAVADKIRGLAIGGFKVDEALLDRFPNLEIISNFGVGYDSIDAALCGQRGIMVTNTPDVLSDEVADTALGLMIMTVRELSAAERWLRAGNWKPGQNYPLTKATLQGRTLGVLGLGRIGKAIATRAEAFGMTVHYHGRTKQEDVSYPYHATLKGLAEACDTLMLVAPGGASTRHMVNAEILEALGPNGILINVGRGTVVDEAALIEALRSGTILSAGLDVLEDEPSVPQALIEMENAVLLPHVASASVHTRDAMGQLVVDNMSSWFRSSKALTPVAETPQSS
ncbi:2-hydroxyacid dehydrogenase [Roseibium polysiphoniae]|uniref:2-hydroxyacid dehydrogenase n=1 Tax=Roseibium polysiphoniae TaxID=2571221 RepID=A0A944GVN7_9HYPH|nr:2-hydroxyacid dehydrogenase [Roseibium polysiphoniae]MBS8262660.1 2-hydroxyacid dehydrogenase [Roseibium polysiphoniae]